MNDSTHTLHTETLEIITFTPSERNDLTLVSFYIVPADEEADMIAHGMLVLSSN